MLARWLDRGLGQILAPDEKIANQPPEDEGAGIVWQFLAPDPKFMAENNSSTTANNNNNNQRVPPSSAFLSPLRNNNRDVQCVHCHQWTPAKSIPSDDNSGAEEEGFRTPFSDVDQLTKDVDQLVLSAAKETAAYITSPPNKIDATLNIFRWCSLSRPLNDKQHDRLKNLLSDDPSLLEARTSSATKILNVPNGYTPLMVATFFNRDDVVKLILELSPNKAHHDRDLQGRTALHIAAQEGHVAVATLLQDHEGKSSPPKTDLAGRTPLGLLLTSLRPKNMSQLKELLFSPDDQSIKGIPTPAKTRVNHHNDLQLVAGHADMPGMRVIMEDSILCSSESLWTSHDGEEALALFAVCDGHDDYGQASQFIVDHVVNAVRDSLQQQQQQRNAEEIDWSSVWTKACLVLDESFKQKRIGGGSTGVFALVSTKLIVVANVGDSRCILVQRRGKETPKQESAQQSAGEEAPTEVVPELKDEDDEKEKSTFKNVVIPLSQDHKPDLEGERDRVIKAGLEVTAETFKNQDGQEETIHKVYRAQDAKLAMSRSFGDFEYKTNLKLPPEEQAVVAVPEVQIHIRDPEHDTFLVLACDGVWDVMSNDDVAKFVLEEVDKVLLEQEEDGSCLAQVGDRLLEECFNRGSSDNMSTVIVALSSFAEKVSGGRVVQGKTLQFS